MSNLKYIQIDIEYACGKVDEDQKNNFVNISLKKAVNLFTESLVESVYQLKYISKFIYINRDNFMSEIFKEVLSYELRKT